jgi:cadmium resistance protein CadD (predicted permease)
MSDFMFFWTAMAAIVIAAIYFRNQTQESRNQVFRTMIDKGQPVPADLFQEPRRPLDGNRLVVAGILLLSLAIAVTVFFSALTYFNEVDERWLPYFGVFPFCLGIACLIAARVIKRHD